MKKLLKSLSPFAPDDSGACSVLYELGGIVVICDAGGCAGNVCGFDEPRWHEKRSALFSAGLRDMDAILGRDERLVKKLAKVCTQVPEAAFTAVIGTPVPAVIATDFHALERMAEKQTGLPCIALNTDGTKYYDKGAEKAYCALFRRFAREKLPVKPGKVGILGATPLDTGFTHARDIVRAMNCTEAVCFGLDSSLDEIRRVTECEKLYVIAPSGLKAAQELHEHFGIPYETGFPCLPPEVVAQAKEIRGSKTLIIHQQIAANALREQMEDRNADCATWFLFSPDLAREQDFRITGEDMLLETIRDRGYEVIIADNAFRRLLRGWEGTFIPFAHHAVSAELRTDTCAP